jgi:type II secretory pathway component GspD/PulD (secretin)
MNLYKRMGCWILLGTLLGSAELCQAEASANQPEVIDERVTLNFRDSSIQQVFDILSRKDKINIVLDKGVGGLVSVNLYNITVKDAIYRVAQAGGYAVELRAGDYVILERKDVGLDHLDVMTQLRTFKVQYSDPKQVAEILGKYLSRYGKVTPLNDRRLIVIEDKPEFIERARKLLLELDVQPKQVLIEAQILEITLDDSEAYGVDWSNIFGSGSNPSGNFGVNGLAAGSVLNGPKAAGLFFSLTNNNLRLFLEAKASRSRVNTLSTPKLLALENQEAKAVIGKSTGYKLTTTINQVTTESIQFLESGVILKVTPSVDQQGRVLLKVHPEVSSTTLNAGIPEKKSTEVTTELLCEDGQSVFIGGLIKKSSSQDKTGVPVLGDLPVLGHLFSATATGVSNTETVVIITPRVVADPRMAREFTEEKVSQLAQVDSLIMETQLKLDPELAKERIPLVRTAP